MSDVGANTALGLAVDLRLSIGLSSDAAHVGELYKRGIDTNGFCWYRDDKHAATRRAIVLAAAEIGRGR